MITCWRGLNPNDFTYAYLLSELLEADRRVSDGAYRDVLLTCFKWREVTFEEGPQAVWRNDIRACRLRGQQQQQ